MSSSYEKQMQEKEKEEMFEEEAQEALRTQPAKAVETNGNDQPGSAEAPAKQPVVQNGFPQTIPVVTPDTPTKLIFAIEQCLDAYTHMTGGGEEAEISKENALEYVFNQHYGRYK